MAKTFLTDDQETELKKKGWKPVPACCYITMYKDEFREDIWNEHCKIVGEDPNKEEITVLIIGTK